MSISTVVIQELLGEFGNVKCKTLCIACQLRFGLSQLQHVQGRLKPVIN